MKKYTVMIPLAGHLVIDVEASDAKDAIARALASDLTIDNVESWDALERFHDGNVCHCPQPWQAVADLAFGEELDGDKEDAA